MIPKNIKSEHITKAIEQIDTEGVPAGRESRKYLLEYKGKLYPSKYVLALANRFANGEELNSKKFGGGRETNGFLARLGFSIRSQENGRENTPEFKDKMEEIKPEPHNERCQECKDNVERMLQRVYGTVIRNHKFEVGVLPEDFENTPYSAKLKEIFEALEGQRGFQNFVRATSLPNCDYFVPNPGFIVEFDESQHFTKPRAITLTKYPASLKLGFDRNIWIRLCSELDKRDNNPPFRDEQRAWYDTLRDFLPAIKGLMPTVRLFAQDLPWCSFDPQNSADVKKFENILRREEREIKINVIEEQNPSLARIIIADKWEGNAEEAGGVLEEVYNHWPKGKKVSFIITCGGFVQFDWPHSVSKQTIGDNKYPNKESLEILVEEARKCAEYVLGNGLREKLSEFTDYITLGVDSHKEKISTTKNIIGEPHVESVFLVSLRNNRYYWTGKSYPTTGQEKGLVRIADLRSHFFDLEGAGKIMILGCHDLTIFNNRNWEKTGKWRKGIKEEFRALAKKEGPSIVFQHPHTSDCINVWSPAWHTLRQLIGNVEKYASAGRWPHIDYHAYNKGKKKGEPHCMLEDVLKKTKKGNSIDFIIRRHNFGAPKAKGNQYD